MRSSSASSRGLMAAGLAAAVAFATAGVTRAATVTDANVFGPSDTVTGSSQYSGSFAYSNATDHTTAAFVFSDSDATPALSVSGLGGSAIDSLRFYDTPQYGTDRVAKNVSVYYSSSNTTSLSASNYTLAGSYTLPVGTDGYYTSLSTDGSKIQYDTISGLNIPAGTQSVLLAFTRPQNGAGFSEIQAFAPSGPTVPEPASMGLVGMGALALLGRRRKA